jgi:arabinogalactan oligomer / maltooligosaccharide transport system permease protein
VTSITAPTPPFDAPPEASFLSRAIAAFSGTTGSLVKLALLAVVDAIAVWAAAILVTNSKWIALAVLVAAAGLLNAIYFGAASAVPAKFLVPGTIFLIAFQIVPIVYTARVAFTNYSTGHILSKAEAIKAIETNTLQPAPNGAQYTMAPAHDASGNLVLVLIDQTTNKEYVGSKKGLTPLPPGTVTTKSGIVTAAKGYKLVTGTELSSLTAQLDELTVPVKGGAIQPQGLSLAVALQPTFRYDEAHGTFVRLNDGAVFRDNGSGSFVSAKGEELEPGWVTNVGTENFSRTIHDKTIRAPFLRVFVWTIVYALGSVFLTFALGLAFAIALGKPGLRFQRPYRSLLVIPYAIPSFLSALIWAGLLNDDFGIINHIFHIHVPWLFNPWWAKVSCLLLNLWLGFPYFFLVCSGALQAIPAELKEAAYVDGGTSRQVFRKVTLPLLLVAVAPLMIASFAFNFNNFVNIYLLTGGGPPSTDQPIAGQTDILISYTYKLAFAAGKGGDYGLATAISIFIFAIVASISLVSFWRTRSLENLA